MIRSSRRGFIKSTGVALASVPMIGFARSKQATPSDILKALIHAPLLGAFYRTQPQGFVTATGLVGLNRLKPILVEDQRLGTEWILRGIASNQSKWTARGWQMLEIGISWQLPNGEFQPSYFHSSSLFLEALARACLLEGRDDLRYRSCLKRGCDWLLRDVNLRRGLKENEPYTHRWYILAACFGQAGIVLGDKSLQMQGDSFAKAGIQHMREDGVNPELGGFDCGYQFVGPLFAYRYYPVASRYMQDAIAKMARKALKVGLQKVRHDGSIDISGSTRIGVERAHGFLKMPNYAEIFQALAYADVVDPHSEWASTARKVAVHAKLLT